MIIKYIGISICVLFCALLLRRYNKTFAVIVSVAGSAILFLLVSRQLNDIIAKIGDISSSVNSTAPYIKLMLKVLGITLVTQFVVDTCRDNGENALASMTEIVAKILVVSMVLPLFETIISIVSGLVK